ncbi:hypothetical protein M8J75_012857 [Diaphorina citri]|nr:hypothetical protein M8J75_012857 [Diaphorina citri]
MPVPDWSHLGAHGVHPSQQAGLGSWVACSFGHVPPNAVKVGRDEDGGMTYVGRAWHEEDLVPAKVAPTHQGAFVAHGGLEHSKFDYEVFTIEGSRVAWQKPSTDEVVPPNALVVGHTRYGEPLYAGRALHEGFLVLGKVHTGPKAAYISWAGKEIVYGDYEVLVVVDT